MKKWLAAVAIIAAATLGTAAQAALRVCADPGGMPLPSDPLPGPLP